jgi:hypothetical protein
MNEARVPAAAGPREHRGAQQVGVDEDLVARRYSREEVRAVGEHGVRDPDPLGQGHAADGVGDQHVVVDLLLEGGALDVQLLERAELDALAAHRVDDGGQHLGGRRDVEDVLHRVGRVLADLRLSLIGPGQHAHAPQQRACAGDHAAARMRRLILVYVVHGLVHVVERL